MQKHGMRQSTVLRLPRNKMEVPKVREESRRNLELTAQEGFLRFADARRTDKIRLVDGDQVSPDIIVP